MQIFHFKTQNKMIKKKKSIYKFQSSLSATKKNVKIKD